MMGQDLLAGPVDRTQLNTLLSWAQRQPIVYGVYDCVQLVARAAAIRCGRPVEIGPYQGEQGAVRFLLAEYGTLDLFAAACQVLAPLGFRPASPYHVHAGDIVAVPHDRWPCQLGVALAMTTVVPGKTSGLAVVQRCQCTAALTWRPSSGESG